MNGVSPPRYVKPRRRMQGVGGDVKKKTRGIRKSQEGVDLQ